MKHTIPIIEKLGGNEAALKKLREAGFKVYQQLLYSWRKQGNIPCKWYKPLCDVCKKENIEYNFPSDFERKREK